MVMTEELWVEDYRYIVQRRAEATYHLKYLSWALQLYIITYCGDV